MQGKRRLCRKSLQKMKPKIVNNSQGQLFEVELEGMVKADHDLVKLSKKIAWDRFESRFGESYCVDNGRPGVRTRLMVGLTYLKYMSDCSDSELLKAWVENPYWQYFCGERYFQQEAPCDRTMMSKWRKRLGEKGAQELFDESLAIAVETGLLKISFLEELYVDTTVQEKNIAYPSEANLLNRARKNLVKVCNEQCILLRQKYTRVGKRLQIQAHRYAQANQWNRMRKVIRKLRTILGRILREIERIVPEDKKHYFNGILELATKLYHSPDTKEKVFSLHEPAVEAIAKGKIHKKFEFGNKVSVVRTRKKGFILGCKALHGNPYDGHTLREALADVEARFGAPIRARIGVDLGYRGHGILKQERHSVFHPRLKVKARKRKLFIRARSSVEASISYLKRCFRMGRNYLKGKLGDILNALFAGAALNLTKVAKALS